jgi:hypothetical protein
MALTRSLRAAAALGAALVVAPAAVAVAQQGSSPQPESKAPQPQQVSDKEIEVFAAAATEVRQLNKQWAPKVEEAAKQGPEAEQKAREQALTEMAQAVERKGMTVDRYQQIFTVARADPEVRRKIIEKMPKDEQQ